MDKQQSLLIFVVLSSLMLSMMSQTFVSTAPSLSASDYNILRQLYELIMQRELEEDVYPPPHQMVRKNSRSPSLRLRFGRSDPTFYKGPPAEEQQYPSLPDAATSEN